MDRTGGHPKGTVGHLRLRTAGALLATLALGGCGSGVGGSQQSAPAPGPNPIVVLTTDQLEKAVLGAEDVGRDFTTSMSNDELTALAEGEDGAMTQAPSTLGQFGCLGEVSVLRDPAPVNMARSMHLGAYASPQALSWAASFETAEDAETSLSDVRTGLVDCTQVTIDQDGVTGTLAITTNDKVIDPGVDSQLNISVLGTISDGTNEGDFQQWMSAAQVGNNVVWVGFTGVDTGDPEVPTGYLRTALGGLRGELASAQSSASPG